jgi:NAD+-dependent secondary alcohol dehydrogenase Adh1
MRAAQLVAYEKDLQVQQADALLITDPHDVIVRVGGAGFCRADIHMWLGQLDAMQKDAGIDLPFTSS